MSLDLKPGESARMAVACDLDTATEMVVSAKCGNCRRPYELRFPIVNRVVARRAEKLCECGALLAFELQETEP